MATRCQPRIVAAAAIATELGVVILVYAGHAVGLDWGLKLPYLTATVAATALLGGTIRTRRAYLQALADRAAALEQQASQQARIAVAAERANIAREMHDIVAHRLAVMITMADAAARKGHSDPDRALAAMKQVSSTGRQALGETRQLLGVLRAETAAADDFAPQPGLSQLEPLLDQLRSTGLQARLAVTGQPFPLPDVVLMDVRMPGTDGIEATRRVVTGTPSARVLVLTTFDLDEYAFTALRYGASGFLLKDAQPAELAAAVRAVASGDAVVAPSVTRRLLDVFASRLPDLRSGDQHGAVPELARLTDRERDVLVRVARGLSNSEIAAVLHVSEPTVKSHLGRILSKLGLRDRVQAVVFAYETGLVRPEGNAQS